MARLKPKGSRVRVDASERDIFSREQRDGTPQLSGRSMVYGLNGNLYQPIRELSIEPDELRPLREQLVRYGLPVGWESELEVEASSMVHSLNRSDQDLEYNIVVAKSNRYIREYLRNQSNDKGWEQFRYSPMCTVKHDGSLNNGGREFVFAPMTPDFARASNAYGAFEATFSRYLWQGHYGENTGGHMHIPLGAFSDQQLVLFYKLIEHFADARVYVEGHENPELAARFIQVIGQRKLGGWARWLRLPDVETYFRQIATQNRRELGTGRYYIVQKSRHNTIELRFPKGTYNSERAIMRTSFVNAMYNYTYMIEQAAYTDVAKVMDIFDVDKFVQFVNEQDRWPELKRYLRRHYNGIGCVTSRGRNKTILEDVDAYKALFVDSIEHAEGRV